MDDATINIADLQSVQNARAGRAIAPGFEFQLTGGVLRPLLRRIQCDDTLSLEIRRGRIDIYYRGGRLVCVRADKEADHFEVEFQEEYCDTGDEYCPLPPGSLRRIVSANDTLACVDMFAAHKQAMDIHLRRRRKIEREYRHAVVRDNNLLHSSRGSDYTVIDIAYTQSRRAYTTGCRFDLVGFRWPLGTGRRVRCVISPVIMEMVVGDGKSSSAGLAGLARRVGDIEAFLTPGAGGEPSQPYLLFCADLVQTFETKRRLGLPTIPRRLLDLEIGELMTRPEVLFIIADQPPKSAALQRALLGLSDRIGDKADYYVAAVQNVGYALFFRNMKPFDEVLAELSTPDTATSVAFPGGWRP
jgi:hypothetical protein